MTDEKILHTTWYGTFLVRSSEDGLVVESFVPAGKDPERIAKDLDIISRGEMLDREREILDGNEVDSLTEKRLRSQIKGLSMVDRRDVDVPPPSEMGFDMNILRDATITMARMKADQGPDDSNIMSGVGALTDIDSSLNLVTERIREWYCKYWEEISPHLEDIEVLSLIAEDADPSSVYERLNRNDINEPGGEYPDLGGLSALAAVAISLWEAREKTEAYLEGEMEAQAPCLAAVAGPLIGARLVHSAGGLMRLAKLPSSTVQVLGAEKMFFKFLKDGGKPPKHGVLFQHPWVHSLPREKRGKMARSIANASAIASRMDAYGGDDPAPLKNRLEKRRQRILKMDVASKKRGGRQPPFREGWWADKPLPGKRGRRKRRSRKRK